MPSDPVITAVLLVLIVCAVIRYNRGQGWG